MSRTTPVGREVEGKRTLSGSIKGTSRLLASCFDRPSIGLGSRNEIVCEVGFRFGRIAREIFRSGSERIIRTQGCLRRWHGLGD